MDNRSRTIKAMGVTMIYSILYADTVLVFVECWLALWTYFTWFFGNKTPATTFSTPQVQWLVRRRWFFSALKSVQSEKLVYHTDALCIWYTFLLKFFFFLQWS